ncbi:MAG: aminomethyl-transferring glycine dehydrogenase subunit GcvPB, partial [Caulobacteraceae bacterium]
MTVLANAGRPTRPAPVEVGETAHPGRGLLQHEPLIFELGGWDKSGVDFEDEPRAIDRDASDLAGLTRAAPPHLPGLSEPETLRHYVRLS